MSIRSRALRQIKKPTHNDVTINVAALNSIVAAARPLIEDWLDIADQLAAFRETADEKNLDWSQIKNLLKATILDERDDGERVAKLSAKAGKISEYLELLKPTSGDKKSPNEPTSFSISGTPGVSFNNTEPTASGEPVRAYPAPSPPAPQPHDDGQSADLALAINGAGSPLADDEGIPEFLRRPLVLQ